MCRDWESFGRTTLLGSVWLVSCAVAGAAYADDSEDLGAPVLHAGGVEIYPGISLTEKSNDNIFRLDANKKSSRITVLSPSLAAQAKKGGDIYSLAYVADLGRYANSSPDNYNDQNLTAEADWAFSSRAMLKLTPQYKVGHDERGSTYSAPTPTVNTWRQSGIAGEFTYGSEESIGRVVVDAHGDAVRYQNNRTVTTAFDKDVNGVAGTFYYRTSPKVYTFVQLGDERIVYKDVISTLSGNERRVMLGATWKASAQTTGSFKVGQLRKTFDSAARTAYRGSSWEGSVRWSPRDFIRVDLSTLRKTLESTGVGNYVLYTNHLLGLEYDLTDRTMLSLNVARATEDFSPTVRSDKTPSYGVKLGYELRKWLVLEAEYSHATKTSTGFTGVSPNYRSNIISVNLHTRY